MEICDSNLFFFPLGERPFQCDFEMCTKTFLNEANLRVHRRMHTG